MSFHDYLVSARSSGRAEYTGLSLLLICFIQVVACLAVRRGFAIRVFEAASGFSVASACVLTLAIRGTYYPRQVIGTILICLLGLRLSSYLFVRGLKSDRINVGARIIWSMSCALPVILANTKQSETYRSTPIEIASCVVAIWAIWFEEKADTEKLLWHNARSEENPRPTRSSTEAPVCHLGLWNQCRHPNYFGELLFHWSLYFILRPIKEPAIVFVLILLSVFIMILPGGIWSQETERVRRYGLYPVYLTYKNTTPVLFPFKWMHRVLGHVSTTFRNVVCLELSQYSEST